jgi:lysozyme
MVEALKASPVLATYPNRLAAINSFVYNCGGPRYRASTLRKRINEENWEAAKSELMKWTRGGGRVLPGLVKRRAAEAALL